MESISKNTVTSLCRQEEKRQVAVGDVKGCRSESALSAGHPSFEHYIPSDLESSFNVKASQICRKLLRQDCEDPQKEGIITKEYGMWKLREDLQDKEALRYMSGRMLLLPLLLSWTPKGIEFIKEIINNRTGTGGRQAYSAISSTSSKERLTM